jgi:uncharacterized membrane protein
MDTRRVEAFSDGVFAVAITVLVFNLLSIAKARISSDELAAAWPQYAGYVVSFLTIGIMWLNHHTVLSHVRRVNRITLVLNLFLLMTVVAVPFPTALVADNLGSGSSPPSARLAAVVYGLVMIAMSIAFSALWMYLGSHAIALGGTEERPPWRRTIRFSGGGLGYVVAVFVAFASAQAALAIYGALAVYYLFEHLPSPPEKRPGAGGDAAADLTAGEPDMASDS